MTDLASYTRQTYYLPITCALLLISGAFGVAHSINPKLGYDYAGWIFLFISTIFFKKSFLKLCFCQRLAKSKKTNLLSGKDFQKHLKKDQIFLGKGFEWDQDACQKLSDVTNSLSMTQSERFHALKPSKPLYAPKSTFGTHTLIFGTTGAGKTKVCESLATQLIKQGDCLIFIDPKGDHGLAKSIQRACQRAGREHDFRLFSPYDPQQSCCLPICATVSTPTEMADLICALLPQGANSDVFNSFCWEAIYALSAGLFILEQRPTFASLKELLSLDDLTPFICEVLTKVLFDTQPSQFGQAKVMSESAEKPSTKRLNVLTRLVKEKTEYMPEGITNLLKLNNQSEHLKKLIGSLDPVLSKLCSGTLPVLLESSADRPSADLRNVLTKGLVLYVSVDSRNDPTISRAISTLILTSLSLLAGRKQSALERGEKLPKTSLFVDEASEASCSGMITLLNKSRSAEFNLFIATQSIADFISALNGQAEATRVLANANSTIVLRSIDSQTQKYITDAFPDVQILDITQRHTAGIKANESTSSSNFTYQTSALFPASSLGELPPLDGLWIHAGKVWKVKFPLLTD